MADEPILRSERLTLRRWRDEDHEPFAQLNADPDVTRYLRGRLDRAASDAFVERIEAHFAEHGYGLWALERTADRCFLGFTGLALQTFDAAFTPAVEVGWRLRRDAWGHGYATEAATAALDFAFGALALQEVVSLTTVANARSRAVMTRLGMTHDPSDDFEHPLLPVGHPARPSVLSRMTRERWRKVGQVDGALGGDLLAVHHEPPREVRSASPVAHRGEPTGAGCAVPGTRPERISACAEPTSKATPP